jgi:hypothetical protein
MKIARCLSCSWKIFCPCYRYHQGEYYLSLFYQSSEKRCFWLRCYHADCEQTRWIPSRFQDALSCSPTVSTQHLPLSCHANPPFTKTMLLLDLTGNAHPSHPSHPAHSTLPSRRLALVPFPRQQHDTRTTPTALAPRSPVQLLLNDKNSALQCKTVTPSLLHRLTNAYTLPSQESRTYTHPPPTKAHSDSRAIKRHDALQTIGVSGESSST